MTSSPTRWHALFTLCAAMSLAACAPGDDSAVSSSAALSLRDVTVTSAQGPVSVSVLASAPRADGLRSWWVFQDGIATLVEAKTLADAIAKAITITGANPRERDGNLSMSLSDQLAYMGIGGGNGR